MGPRDPDDIEPGTRPEAPARELNQFRARDGSFAFQYPRNWDALAAGDESNLIFAPRRAYGQRGEAIFVTHGIFAGTIDAPASDLAAANAAFVEQQIRANPDFRVERQPQRVSFGDRAAYATVVAGPSPVTGVREIDVIYTTATTDGRLFYLITMAPEDEFGAYQSTFEEIIRSLRLAG